jgi:lipopolysaccharide biosynthesis regulator YciM
LRRIHYITIIATVALIALLYWGGNIIPPAKTNMPPQMASGMAAPTQISAANFDSMLAVAHKNLPQHAVSEIETVEKNIVSTKDSGKMSSLFIDLAQLWHQHKQPTIAAYYTAKAAKLDNSEKKLTFAAQFLLDRMSEDASESLQMWDAQQAVDCFQRALKLNPDDDSATIGLAKGLVATGQTMQGVQLLRGITQKDSTNIPANMLLGQLAITSGQFDKAVNRFQVILNQQAENTEAMYLLAQAYKGKGDKTKAIALLEECKKIVNKPDFSRDIDKYINSFK